MLLVIKMAAFFNFGSASHVWGVQLISQENNGTALYLGSTGYLKSIAMFNTGSRVYFRRNSGYKGGAIVLSGNSALYIHSDYRPGDDYIYFYFLNKHSHHV